MKIKLLKKVKIVIIIFLSIWAVISTILAVLAKIEVEKWHIAYDNDYYNKFLFPKELGVKDLGYLYDFDFHEFDPSGVSWNNIHFSYNRFVSSSSNNYDKDTLLRAIYPRIYCTTDEFMIVTTEDEEINSKRVIRMNRKTGKIYNPATRLWGHYGFVNDEAINKIKLFTKNITYEEVINQIGEPHLMNFNQEGKLYLVYITEKGRIFVEFNNGFFNKYRLFDNWIYL